MTSSLSLSNVLQLHTCTSMPGCVLSFETSNFSVLTLPAQGLTLPGWGPWEPQAMLPTRVKVSEEAGECSGLGGNFLMDLGSLVQPQMGS